jgi:hypothetical protein
MLYILMNRHICLEEPAAFIFRVEDLEMEAAGTFIPSYMASRSRIP